MLTDAPERPERTHIYLDAINDSRRWDGFRFRPGDVVVSTAPKCGTTWTLQLCAMLLAGSPHLDKPLSTLTPCLDQRILPQYPLFARLDAHEGRRLFKTHIPLDGLPYFPEVRYVVCGRDPRDAFLSMLDHTANTSLSYLNRHEALAGLPLRTQLLTPHNPNAIFQRWASVGQFPWMQDGAHFQSVLSFNETWWRFRHLPNIHLVHYRDLSLGLEAETRRLAAFIDTPIDAALWPAIVKAGSFDAMRANADMSAPGGQGDIWIRNEDFFRAARMEQWREVISPANQKFYEDINRDRFDPAFKAWLEQGRSALAD